MKRVCLYCVLLWAAVACAPGDNKYSERDFVGIWVEPVPGMAGVQGIALEEDGAAHSVNMATLRYETWKYEKGSVNRQTSYICLIIKFSGKIYTIFDTI